MQFFQGGRRYFSRREITALVDGPGNMAVYRNILVIPPTAKVLPLNNKKSPAAVLHYRRKNTAIFWFYRFRQKSTANSRYRQKVSPTLKTAKRVPPTLDTAQKVPPTLDNAQKVTSILDTAAKVPRTLDTAQKIPAFLFVFVLCSLLFLVLRVPFR